MLRMSAQFWGEFNSILTLSPRESIRCHRLKVESSPSLQKLSQAKLSSVLLGGQPETGSSSDTLFGLQTSVAHPGCYLYFWLTGRNSEVPTTLYSSSSYLLGQLTEFLERFYLLDCQLAVDAFNARMAGWTRCTGQGSREGHGASIPSVRTPLSPSLYLFPRPGVHQTLPFCGFWWRLHYPGMMMASLTISDWTSSVAPPPSAKSGMGLNILTLSWSLAPLASRPHP